MDERDLDRLRKMDRELSGSESSGPPLALIIPAALLLAVLAWTIFYGWPWWVGALCVLALIGLGVIALRRRGPVPPIELTADQRDRVGRVLQEHGLRPAVNMVKGWYPDESTASAVAAVHLVARRTR